MIGSLLLIHPNGIRELPSTLAVLNVSSISFTKPLMNLKWLYPVKPVTHTTYSRSSQCASFLTNKFCPPSLRGTGEPENTGEIPWREGEAKGEKPLDTDPNLDLADGRIGGRLPLPPSPGAAADSQEPVNTSLRLKLEASEAQACIRRP